MAIEQIEQDIAAIEKAVDAIAAELHSAYTSYLVALGQAVRQQLILASYHLCTQGYPAAFLNLSFSQRQQLQQAIRKLGQQAAAELITHTRTEEDKSEVETSAPPIEDEDGSAESIDTPVQEPEPAVIESEANLPDAVAEETVMPKTVLTAPQNQSFSPMLLAQWQQNLEQKIVGTLRTTSHKANRLLQQAGLLPKKFPEQLLEAAANSSEAGAEHVSGPPNLLNLLIETEDAEVSEETTVTHIVAVHLRLTEIEFADATTRAGRNQIRNLLTKASKLGREHHKKQRERTVAQAEGAWRSSWFDE